MAEIDDVLTRLAEDPGFRQHVRSDPGAALKDSSLSTDDLARVQEALGSSPAGPSMQSLFTDVAATGRSARLRGLLAPASIAVVALVLGITGGAAGLAGGSATTTIAPLTAVPISDCPGGSSTGELHRGDKVRVVGRDESGEFVAIRSPRDPSAVVWLHAQHVTGAPATRVAVRPYDPRCQREIVGTAHEPASIGEAASSTTTTPSDASSTTVAEAAPTTAPTPRTAPTPGTAATPGPVATTPTTAASGDRVPPAIQGTNASPGEIWEHYSPAGGLCSTQTTSVVSAKVSDSSGVGSVTMSWSIGKVNGSSPMSLSGGSYRGTLGPFDYKTVPDGTVGQIAVTVTAADLQGNFTSASINVPLHSASECIG